MNIGFPEARIVPEKRARNQKSDFIEDILARHKLGSGTDGRKNDDRSSRQQKIGFAPDFSYLCRGKIRPDRRTPMPSRNRIRFVPPDGS